MDFVLPGAENFSAYLKSVVEGELTIEGPEVIDWSYGVDYTKRWIVKLDGKFLGVYCTFGPKPGETEFERSYNGRIPGYINEAVVIHNRSISFTIFQIPADQVILAWSNKKFVDGNLSENRWPQIIDVPWVRQDGHTAIPFP